MNSTTYVALQMGGEGRASSRDAVVCCYRYRHAPKLHAHHCLLVVFCGRCVTAAAAQCCYNVVATAINVDTQVRSMPIRKGDYVRLVRGDTKNHGDEGEVQTVYRKKYVIHVERIQRDKANGAYCCCCRLLLPLAAATCCCVCSVPCTAPVF